MADTRPFVQVCLRREKTEISLQPGAYLAEIASMARAELAPLSNHMTPNIGITITSAKKIRIMHLIVAQYY